MSEKRNASVALMHPRQQKLSFFLSSYCACVRIPPYPSFPERMTGSARLAPSNTARLTPISNAPFSSAFATAQVPPEK